MQLRARIDKGEVVAPIAAPDVKAPPRPYIGVPPKRRENLTDKRNRRCILVAAVLVFGVPALRHEVICHTRGLQAPD
jgi:hypothetical protein